jgi:hypothetical protein
MQCERPSRHQSRVQLAPEPVKLGDWLPSRRWSTCAWGLLLWLVRAYARRFIALEAGIFPQFAPSRKAILGFIGNSLIAGFACVGRTQSFDFCGSRLRGRIHRCDCPGRPADRRKGSGDDHPLVLGQPVRRCLIGADQHPVLRRWALHRHHARGYHARCPAGGPGLLLRPAAPPAGLEGRTGRGRERDDGRVPNLPPHAGGQARRQHSGHAERAQDTLQAVAHQEELRRVWPGSQQGLVRV